MDFQHEIAKIKWQLVHIAETIDSQQYPIPSMIISLDLDKEQFKQLNDRFDFYNNLLREGKDWTDFEFRADFEKKLDIDHQALKTVILAFWGDNMWVEVCHHYINQYHCVEFDSLGVYKP